MPGPALAALSTKLLIDTKSKRVLFAEASKEVVDFLFSLLALPVATAVKLVGKDAMVGCVGNLYASVDKLDATYVQPGAAKDSLLFPTMLSLAASSNSSLLRLPAAPPSGQRKCYYKCSGYCNNITETSGSICPGCGSYMNTAALMVTPKPENQVQNAPAGGAKGFVQGIVTYTVLDNLTITPMSTISGITLLNTFAVTSAICRRRPCSSATMRAWRFSRRRCNPRPSSLMSSSATRTRPPAVMHYYTTDLWYLVT
ncbi:unnamed protein product [Urochloa humidicola]